MSSVVSENVFRPFYLAFLLLRMHWWVYSDSLGVTYERGLAHVGVYVLYVSSHTGSKTPTDLLIKASQRVSECLIPLQVRVVFAPPSLQRVKRVIWIWGMTRSKGGLLDVILRVVLLSWNQRRGESVVFKDRNGPSVVLLWHIEQLPLKM